jgi:Right handed beta helix region
MTLNNVPDGIYDLYVYGINGSDAAEGNSTAFTVNGITMDTKQTTTPNNSALFVQNATYVKLTRIAPLGGTISIHVTGAGVGGNPNEADFNGLQLVTLTTNTAPLLTVASSGTNVVIAVTNVVSNAKYDLYWTLILADPDYPWVLMEMGVAGQTNFTVNSTSSPSGFFRLLWDTNNLVNPGNPVIPAGVGAVTPFTSYEAEAGVLGGGASIVSVTSPASGGYSSAKLEASGHAYVQLTNTGQSVQWTNNTGHSIDALNLRSYIPDALTGGGITNTIDLYVNGTFRQALSVNSAQNYCYEGTNYNGQTDKTPADGDPRDFWNDTHYFVSGATIAPGDVFALQKDSTNSAAFYCIDVIDVENVGLPLNQPANSLSIINFGAVSNNVAVDNTSAINNCFSAARSQGKSAWIPAGTYYISSGSGLLNATGITIAGAGPWYSTIYRATTSGYVGNIIQATSCTLSNVLLDCNGFSRDAGNNNGAVNFAGTNWVVNNVWIQHVTSAFWCAGVGGIAENCRVLSVWSDGGNFNPYQSGNGIGNDLTYSNNFVRSTGDDGMAINATDDSGYTPMTNIRYVSNTQIAAWGGGGMSVYGGRNLVITNNLITDSPRYDGLRIGNASGTTAATSNVLAQGNVLLRCGGNGYGDMIPAITMGIDQTTFTNAGITVQGNVVINPVFGGMEVHNTSGFIFSGNIISAPSMTAIRIIPSAQGSGSFTSNIVFNLPLGVLAYTNQSSSFEATLSKNSWQ